MQPAQLWKSLKTQDSSEDKAAVQCRLCNHYCIIQPDESGICGVRINIEGQLHSLVADKIAAINVDPVEKKPLYHFQPSSRTFSIGTMGCNLHCPFCQNHSLSQPPSQGEPVAGKNIAPADLVEQAKYYNCQSIAYTYSEPTIFFELLYETARLAKQRNLKNIMVSNGFMSNECLEALGPYVDAANIDLKAFSEGFYHECGGRLEPVKNNLIRIKEMGWWLEVTTLLIPDLNDSIAELTKMAVFIAEKLGPETPWHLSRFHPDYRMLDRKPTPVQTLERAWRIGKEAGLQYVYIGNVPGHERNSTFCPECGAEVIPRLGFQINSLRTACPECGHVLAGVDLGFSQT